MPNQNFGSLNSNTNSGTFSVLRTNNCFINVGGIVELFDFDRCTAAISNTN
jgi:hypothetical protein